LIIISTDDATGEVTRTVVTVNERETTTSRDYPWDNFTEFNFEAAKELEEGPEPYRWPVEREQWKRAEDEKAIRSISTSPLERIGRYVAGAVP
jgi:hypothetical protein